MIHLKLEKSAHWIRHAGPVYTPFMIIYIVSVDTISGIGLFTTRKVGTAISILNRLCRMDEFIYVWNGWEESV